jgi:hypothetical protein
MIKSIAIGMVAALAVAGSAAAQQPYVPRNYEKGPVTLVQEFRIAPGKFNAFMVDYAANQRRALEIGKAKDGILSYGVSQLITRREADPNVITVITFKNLAAYDRSFERADATAVEVYGSLQKASEAAAARAQYTTLINSRLYQGLTIK